MAEECRHEATALDVAAARSQIASLVSSSQSSGEKVLAALNEYQQKVAETIAAAVPSRLDQDQLEELDTMHHLFCNAIQDLEKAVRILCKIPVWKSDLHEAIEQASSSSARSLIADSLGSEDLDDAAALEERLAVLQGLGLQAAVKFTSQVLAVLPSEVVPAHKADDAGSDTSTRFSHVSGSGSIASSSALEIKRSRVLDLKKPGPQVPGVAVVPLLENGKLGESLLTIPRVKKNKHPTALRVKEVVAEDLGLPSAAEVKLVIRSNGTCVAHRDEDLIRSNRVFVVGLDDILKKRGEAFPVDNPEATQKGCS